MGSMKSGPTLKLCTCTPRPRKAPRIPRTMEVFPTPLCVPAMTRRGNLRDTVSVAMSIHHPTHREAQHQTRSARGIHDANRLGNTADVERTNRVSKIWLDIDHPVIGVGTAEPDTQSPCHGRLRNARVWAWMTPPVAPANTPASPWIAPCDPRPYAEEEQP